MLAGKVNRSSLSKTKGFSKQKWSEDRWSGPLTCRVAYDKILEWFSVWFGTVNLFSWKARMKRPAFDRLDRSFSLHNNCPFTQDCLHCLSPCTAIYPTFCIVWYLHCIIVLNTSDAQWSRWHPYWPTLGREQDLPTTPLSISRNTSENISHEQYFVTSIFLKILKGNATHIASRLMAMTCSWALSLPFLQAKFPAAVTSSRRSFSSAADTLWGIPRIWGGRRSGGRSLRNARRSHKAQELYQRELENCWRLCHNTLE